MLPLLIAGEDEARARSRAEELLAAGGAGRADDRTGRRRCRAGSSSGGRRPRARGGPAGRPGRRAVGQPGRRATASGCTASSRGWRGSSRPRSIVVTHNRALAARADRVLSLEGGRLVPLSGVESMP